ncbi:MAG: choice-of-anchor D domain-containing protein, partial [Deltaproteobacteria bacterium]|nr:choice-of-anchor D domain-containing protein [Deltaproteobacteria bacterium]
MRIAGFILAVACLVACGQPRDRVREHVSPLVVLDGDGNFGRVAVTTVSDPRTFTVSPAPPADSLQFDRIESIESTCPEFEVEAPEAAGAVVQRFCVSFEGGGYGGGELSCTAFQEVTYAFGVRFRPTLQLPTSDQCRIIVRLDGGSSKSIAVSGVGIPPPLSADISPQTPIDFLTVNLGTTSAPPRVIKVTNTGSQPLTVSATTQLAGAVFAVTGTTSSHQIAPGGVELYQVTCTPTSAAAFTGSITFTTNDPDAADASVAIPFQCSGIDHPVGNVGDDEAKPLVGTSTKIVIKLTNLSATDPATGLAVALQQPGLPGLELTTPPLVTLAPLQTTTAELTWTPPEPYKGPLGGLTLSVDG